jgi:hypothetical protein
VADYKITSPRLQVLRGSVDAPEILEVQTLSPDLIAFDMTRAKHRWPDMKEAPMLWLSFIAWHACRREQRIPPELTWDEWKATTLDVGPTSDEEDGEPVDPTRADLAPD